MEITELNLIGDFEAGIKCLQNPSLIAKLPQLYSFWTFGALILAIFATFTSVFNKIKLLFHQIRLKVLSSCQNSCPQQIFNDDDFDFDFEFSDDGDDDTPSSVAESDDDDEIMESEDDGVNAVFRAEGGSYWGNDDQGYNGNFTNFTNSTLRRRRNGFSWSDFSAGKSVVQLWDSFGLGLDFEDDDESEYAIWDSDRCHVAATAEEKVVLTAEMDGRCPAIYAAWRPRQREIWSENDGVGGRKEE